MSVSISGSNSISGLGGQDTDFDKVLSQLKQIESTQLKRLESWKSDWNLRYEAFTQIIDQVQAASSMLSSLSDKNNFIKKLVQSSNDNVVTAVANASAQDVQHTIKISQVASNAIWANGHVYDSKNAIINTSGTDQYFNYIYAGKEHNFKVPANTTLESFASMLNNSADNPGVKVSLIQTGQGYVFQVAGKETGASNDLLILDSKLVGMDATGTTSTWQSNNTLDPSKVVTNPTSYVFDLTLANGKKKSLTIKGDASPQDLVVQLNNLAGGISASIDASGNLSIEGVKSFSRRLASEQAYTAAGLKFTMNGEMKDNTGQYVRLNATGGIADGLQDSDVLTFNIEMQDGSFREVTVTAGTSKRDLFAALGQATQDGGGADLNLSGGSWSVDLIGVKAITVNATNVNGAAANTPLTSGFTTSNIASKGSKDTLGAQIGNASTTLTFDASKLSRRIDGLLSGDGEKLVFTVIDKDGNAKNISIDSDKTNEDLLNALVAEGIVGVDGTDGDGNRTFTMANVMEFRLSKGSLKEAGYTSELKVDMQIGATNANPDPSDGSTSKGDLFFLDTADNQLKLEKTPDLKYVVKANNGSTGTLKVPSGTSMKDILAKLQDKDAPEWTWVDADGNSGATPPDSWEVSFTDADGNPVTDPDSATGKIYLEMKDVQSVKGASIAGQIASSSNWSIQRAANACYQVDNWPVEMESTTNSVSDVIEGVVFSIQETGEARISVSTDITSVEESIQNFLDAVNSVLLTVNELMKYDESKEVTSSDPNDIGNSNYSQSGLTNQKGSLLTGNYGVQLFKSRFSSVVGAVPPGFKSRQSADDVLSGDLLASLANLGIKTDTDTTSDTYGLLTIAPSSSIAALQSLDKDNYTDMINNHLDAVVDFFCASGAGASTSTDFRYGSHVEGITKAGTYEVKYTVQPDGSITNVTVGGEPAKQDLSQPGNYFSVASGDPRGLSILIDDLTVGDHPPAGEGPNYIRIKQGLVQTTNQFLKDELVFNDVSISANSTPDQVKDAIALKSKNGALMSLRDNYKKVMESIDVKIEREQRRISTWESRQKAIFANLETLLNSYSQQQKQLESQLAQLSGN